MADQHRPGYWREYYARYFKSTRPKVVDMKTLYPEVKCGTPEYNKLYSREWRHARRQSEKPVQKTRARTLAVDRDWRSGQGCAGL